MLSLRQRLLTGLGLCTAMFVVAHAALVYRDTLAVLNTAYDRSLLASAKTIAESLELRGEGDSAQVVATVPYSALEAFEADSRSRMAYRVLGLRGEHVSGYPDLLPNPTGPVDLHPYAALVQFFDASFENRPVRVARLAQPVANSSARGMATVEVSETLELRQRIARQAMGSTLMHHALLLCLLAAVVWWVVHSATRGVRNISAAIEGRDPQDLSPVDLTYAPLELRPALEATNRVMARLHDVGEEQKRFVRDASHQLRTPLAVLKVQAQSALRGDVPPLQGLAEINETIDQATVVANQMLALAKVEQLRLVAERDGTPSHRLDAVVRDIALELAPLIAQKHLDFDIHTEAVTVQAHDWMLRELSRNLLANAIRFSPDGAALDVQVRCEVTNGNALAILGILDHGPGLLPDQIQRMFQPFNSLQNNLSQSHSGAGLGLVICKDICNALGGEISLNNAPGAGVIALVTLRAVG